MKKNIITISRQFGSGGRTVGRQLAERLNIPFYDRELVKQVAEETGFDTKFIEENGEFSPSKSIFPLRYRRVFPVCKTGFRFRILFFVCSGRLF